MAFVLAFLVGLLIGIALVMGFVMVENRRSVSRAQIAAAIHLLSNLTLDDAKQLFSKGALPHWIVFPRREKVEWLNHGLQEVWPYVDKAASELAREIVEPILEQYRPALVSSLKFQKFTLGTVAPQFVGVQMLSVNDDEIIMELELDWDGNPSIILNVNTVMGVQLPIQIKDLAFSGIFRLAFKPLVESIPCFGAVVFSLRKKKNLDFRLKVIGGDVSTVPGLQDAIDGMIRAAVIDSLLWPMRRIIPILPGDYTNLEMRPVGTLEVKIVQARDLLNKDLVGKSDPFAIVFIRPLPAHMKKTKTINNDLDPIWNEQFIFEVEDVATQELTVQIYDEEGVQAAQLLGGARFPLKDLEPGVLKEVELALVKDLENAREHKDRGLVRLELLYNPFGQVRKVARMATKGRVVLTPLETVLQASIQEQAQSSPEVMMPSPRTESISDYSPSIFSPTDSKQEDFVRGILSVTIERAEDLIPADYNGKSDPYVVLNMKKSDQKQKTKIIYKTLNPEWNQTFDFVVEDAIHDLLILKVWDHDTFRNDYMGRCVVTLSRVILERECDLECKLDGVESGRVYVHLRWNPQPISEHLNMLNA